MARSGATTEQLFSLLDDDWLLDETDDELSLSSDDDDAAEETDDSLLDTDGCDEEDSALLTEELERELPDPPQAISIPLNSSTPNKG